jgi:hypothetical protein
MDIIGIIIRYLPIDFVLIAVSFFCWWFGVFWCVGRGCGGMRVDELAASKDPIRTGISIILGGNKGAKTNLLRTVNTHRKANCMI